MTPQISIITLFCLTSASSFDIFSFFGKNDQTSEDTFTTSIPTTVHPNITNTTEKAYDSILDLEYRLPSINPHLVNHSFENPAKFFSWMAGGFVNLIMAPFEDIEQLASDVLVNRTRLILKKYQEIDLDAYKRLPVFLVKISKNLFEIDI